MSGTCILNCNKIQRKTNFKDANLLHLFTIAVLITNNIKDFFGSASPSLACQLILEYRTTKKFYEKDECCPAYIILNNSSKLP
jgi:hypothetical protein